MSALTRLYVTPQTIHASTIRIEDPNIIHYVTRVRRLSVGSRVECFDGRGGIYHGVITATRNSLLDIHIERAEHREDLGVAITLAQAIPKGDRFEWVLQKATELGVGRIIPLMTHHTVVRTRHADEEKKSARWQRIVQEAAKQCGRATVPQVEPLQAFKDFIPSIAGASLALIPTLVTVTQPLRDVLQQQVTLHDATIIIGPEGDFTNEEVQLAQASGATAVSLGSLTLRTETATLATLAILRYSLGLV